MEVSLMKVAIRVNDVESKFVSFNFALDDWLAKDMRIVTNVKLSTPRSKWCMLLHLSFMSALNHEQPMAHTHCLHIPTRLNITLYHSTITLYQGVVDHASL